MILLHLFKRIEAGNVGNTDKYFARIAIIPSQSPLPETAYKFLPAANLKYNVAAEKNFHIRNPKKKSKCQA